MDVAEINAILKIASSVDWSAWVTAIATLVLTFLTFAYVRITRKILDSQSDPCVIISVIHDNERPTVLQLVAKNIGSGLAHDITFQFSKPLPKKAWGISQEQARDVILMNDGPLILGIPALGPGEDRRLDWGQYGGLIKAIGEEPIIATTYFKKNGRKMRPVKSYLDIKSFEYTNASESSIAKIAKNLEKLSIDIGRLSTGYHKLEIKIVEFPDQQEEVEEEHWE